MTRFATFGLLYLTALFLEWAEQWKYPPFTWAILLLICLALLVGFTRLTFLVLLGVTTAHFVLVQFPDVANHVNVEIYCNVLMMLGIVYSLVRKRAVPTDDNYFEMVRPVLQLTLILVYSLAGFHKLNADFFNPEISCVKTLLGDLTRVARLDVAGVPAGLWLAAGAGAVACVILTPRLQRARHPVALRVGVIALFVAAAGLVLRLAPGVSGRGSALLTVGMTLTVLTWELIGGVLLAFSSFQAPLLAFSWIMHSTLALSGFVDFAALALALLYAFIPRPYAALLDSRVRLPLPGATVHRAHLYLAINVLGSLVPGPKRQLVAGILFNVATLVLIWPMLARLAGPLPRPVWGGVSLASRLTPRWMVLFPAVLVLHGFMPYVGLRTAGTFSMFSNLRTEGAVSNHLFLSRNPLKVWDYQEDVVRFRVIDDRAARIGYQYHKLQGNALPVVEFRKLIYAWTRAGAKVPMTFEYRGAVHSTGDIVTDPVWQTPARDWEMRLMDFRVIQPDGPNRCRW